MGTLSKTASEVHTKYHRPTERSSEYKGVPLHRDTASSAKIDVSSIQSEPNEEELL